MRRGLWEVSPPPAAPPALTVLLAQDGSLLPEEGSPAGAGSGVGSGDDGVPPRHLPQVLGINWGGEQSWDQAAGPPPCSRTPTTPPALFLSPSCPWVTPWLLPPPPATPPCRPPQPQLHTRGQGLQLTGDVSSLPAVPGDAAGEAVPGVPRRVPAAQPRGPALPRSVPAHGGGLPAHGLPQHGGLAGSPQSHILVTVGSKGRGASGLCAPTCMAPPRGSHKARGSPVEGQGEVSLEGALRHPGSVRPQLHAWR